MSTQRNSQPGALPDSPTRFYLAPPPGPVIPLPDRDARTYALEILAKWISALVFQRTMAPSAPTQPFSIPPDRVFIEQPDNVEGLQFPTIGILPGRGQYLTRGIGGAEPDDDEATVDGRALLVPFDYTELVPIEIWGSKIPERRAIIAGLEVAFGSYEGTTDLRLIMPDYYNLVATFSLMERENVEDIETPRGRRRAHLYVQMNVPVVVAARFVPLDVGVNLSVEGLSGLSGALGQAAVEAALLSQAYGPEAALSAMGLSVSLARRVVRAQMGLTPAQTDALTLDYLFQACFVLAARNASYENWYGRPPYSPGETWADEIRRRLPRLELP